MEFCQIQLNYIDYEFQKAREKLDLPARYNIPVWVMEPLRGGRLCAPKPPFDARIQEAFPDLRPHEAAFRFLQSIPQVSLTLSGMSNIDELSRRNRLKLEPMPMFEPDV